MNLNIRKIVKDDLNSLYKLLSDKEVMKYLEKPFDMEKTKDFLTNAGLSDPPLVYAVDLNNEFIGYVIYHAYDDDSMEIGWVLFPDYWHKGYAKELTKMMIDRAKKDNKNVVIECLPVQDISKHIAKKYNFTYLGIIDGLEVFKLLII